MSKSIQVKLVPTVNYGKFQYLAEPINEQGTKVLDACKTQFGYKPNVKNGKEYDRKTFAPEWVDFLNSNGIDLIVNEAPTIPQYNTGEEFRYKADTPSVDLNALF